MIYLELLWAFIQIGLFSIGGGYAAMPLIQHQAIDVHGWLTMQSFADIMTISQMTPGPIAINAATFVGIQAAAIPGALVATFGCVLPSSIIVLSLAFIYYRFKGLKAMDSILKGLRPAVVAMIASAALRRHGRLHGLAECSNLHPGPSDPEDMETQSDHRHGSGRMHRDCSFIPCIARDSPWKGQAGLQ